MRAIRPFCAYAAALVGAAAVTACGGSEQINARELAAQGRRVFVRAGCGACHTVAAAHTHGRIGPDFDTSEQLTRAQILLQLNAGGGSMPSFQQTLTAQQKDAVTEFVFDTLNERRLGRGE